MNYVLYIAIALLPSIVWLLFYLRKDRHPEPKKMILKVFIWGVLVAFPVLVAESILMELVMPHISLPPLAESIVKYLLIVAVVEESFKYFVVKFKVIDSTAQIDEPTDAMIYMIVAALGFAAIENVVLLTPLFENNFAPTLQLTFSRFIGATFIHVLASATIGYYIALSFARPDKKIRLLIHGFIIAICIHGFYNVLVVRIEDYPYLILLVAFIIASSAYTISVYFKNVSKMKSISLGL